MAKMVRIQSDVTIRVTTGLQHKDVTNKDSDIPNRLKVSSEWPKHTIVIRKGAHLYPAEIKDWTTVQALQKDGILTIGEVVEEVEVDEKMAKDVTTAKDAKEEFKLGAKKGKTITLSDLSSD